MGSEVAILKRSVLYHTGPTHNTAFPFEPQLMPSLHRVLSWGSFLFMCWLMSALSARLAYAQRAKLVGLADQLSIRMSHSAGSWRNHVYTRCTLYAQLGVPSDPVSTRHGG